MRSERERKIRRRTMALRFWRVGMAWYRMTMSLGEKGPPVRTVASIDEVVAEIARGTKYRADHLADKMSHPSKVEGRLAEGKTIGDCEDHAAWTIAVLLKSRLVERAWLVTVQFIDDQDELGGHAVCAFEDEHGVTWWIDYRAPTLARDWTDLAHQVAARYRADAIGVTWMLAEVREDDGLRLRKGGYRVFDVA